MGVLDDAIREPLDLRRRQGVAEEELRRQEEEALGPARRAVASAEAEDGAALSEEAEAAAAAEAEAEEPAAEAAPVGSAPVEQADPRLHEPADELGEVGED